MAIEYGMSADEFWKDDPQLFVSYRTSFINKKKREMEELDYKCWLNGLYTHDGNGKLMLSLKQMLNNMFAKTPDKTQIDSYPKLPYNELAKSKEQEKKVDKTKEYRESIMYFGSIKKIYLDKMLNKKKGDD